MLPTSCSNVSASKISGNRAALRGLALACALAATLAGCARGPAGSPSAAMAKPAADYRNGWYHWSAPGEDVAAVARLYGRDPQLVAELNKTSVDKPLAAKSPIYVPPVEDREELKTIIHRVAADPSLIARTPPSMAPLAAKSAPAQPLAGREEASLPTDASYKPRRARAGSGGFVWPAQGEIMKKFSDEDRRPFRGVTIKTPVGSPVVAARAGKVIFSGELNGYGKMVIVDHGDGFVTCYGYNDKLLISGNQTVKDGQKIAVSGRPNENAQGQVFFQIRKTNQPVDPMDYLN